MKTHFDLNGNLMDMFERASALAPMLFADNFYSLLKMMHPGSVEREFETGSKPVKVLLLVDVYGTTLSLFEDGTMYIEFFSEQNKFGVYLNTSGFMLEYKDKHIGMDRVQVLMTDNLEYALLDEDEPFFDEADIKLDIPFLLNGGIAQFMEAITPRQDTSVSSILDIANTITALHEYSDSIAALLKSIGSMSIGKPVLLGRSDHFRAVPFLYKGNQHPLLSIKIDKDIWIAFHDEGAVFGYAFGCGPEALGRCIGPEDELHDDVIIFSSIEEDGYHSVDADTYIMHYPVISTAVEQLVKAVFDNIKK